MTIGSVNLQLSPGVCLKKKFEISWSSAQRDLGYTLWVIELSYVIEFSTAVFPFGNEEEVLSELLSIDVVEEPIPPGYYIRWPHNYIDPEDAKVGDRLRRKQVRPYS